MSIVSGRVQYKATLNSHGGTLNDSRYDTDRKLDTPAMVTCEGDPDTISDELTSGDCDRLDSDHGTSEASGREFSNVYRGDRRRRTDTWDISPIEQF